MPKRRSNVLRGADSDEDESAQQPVATGRAGLGGLRLTKALLGEEDLAELRAALTVQQSARNPRWGAPPPFAVFRETEHLISVPRHFPLKPALREAARPALCAGEAATLIFRGSLTPLQEQAVRAMREAYDREGGGILSLYCGGGKTVCALRLVADVGQRTLVVVHKEFLVEQWIERIRHFLPEARIGRIKQNVAEVHGTDVVVGMLQSLTRRGDEYSLGGFGHVVVDECHHICARSFSSLLFGVGGVGCRLLGLSATATRSDGLTQVLHWFMGATAFSATRGAAAARRVRVRRLRGSGGDAVGGGSGVEIVSALAEDERRSRRVAALVAALAASGRKVLVLSDRRAHLLSLQPLVLEAAAAASPAAASRLPEAASQPAADTQPAADSQPVADSQPAAGAAAVGAVSVDFYLGGMRASQLRDAAEKSVLLGTYGMSSEGLDIAALDTLVLATPRANVEQSVGRIMRGGAANEPLVVDVVDGGAYCARLASKRLSLYRSAGYQLDDVGGGGDGSDGGDVDGDAASDADEDAVADTGAGAADDGEAAEGAGQGSAGAVVGAAGARGGSGDVRVLIDGFRFRPQVHAQGACAAGSTHSAGGLVRSKYFAC